MSYISFPALSLSLHITQSWIIEALFQTSRWNQWFCSGSCMSWAHMCCLRVRGVSLFISNMKTAAHAALFILSNKASQHAHTKYTESIHICFHSAAGQQSQGGFFVIEKTHTAHCWTVSNVHSQMMKVRLPNKTLRCHKQTWMCLQRAVFVRRRIKCKYDFFVFYLNIKSFTSLLVWNRFTIIKKLYIQCINAKVKVHRHDNAIFSAFFCTQ